MQRILIIYKKECEKKLWEKMREKMWEKLREKILENGRWTYLLLIKKIPISTISIENAPCLVCPVEQKCSLEGEISPRNCQLIEDWVLTVISKSKKKAKWS